MKKCDDHDLSTLKGSQAFILAHKGKLSGSRARGDATPSSDWDYYLSMTAVRHHLKPTLTTQDIPWDSPFIGAITWRPQGIMLEVSSLFPTKPPYRS